MSIESAKAFYNKMTSDEAFKAQYQNASSEEECKEIILSNGYSFTPEEWQAVLAEAANSSEAELSDRELTEVSGGMRPIPGLPEKTPILEPIIPYPRPIYGEPTF